MKKLTNILWPSFIAAGIAEVVLFTFIDPADFDASRMTVYSAGFFALWLIGAVSSALTCFFQRSADEINRCPLEPAARPEGCPKREVS
jgi:hypothetical protein